MPHTRAIGTFVKRVAPWWMKLGAKLLLSRLKFSYRAWKVFGLFEHGRMDDPETSFQNFKLHLTMAGFQSDDVHAMANGTMIRPPKDFTVLELGPGDSLYTAVIARAYGAVRCYLVDTGDYASHDLESYRALARFLSDRGLNAPSLGEAKTLQDVLTICDAVYLTNGLESLRCLPAASVDFLFSNAVLEHIRKHDWRDMLAETRRLLKPQALCSHRVDLGDHLGGGLNNLRFPERVWESEFMANSGFYTNRIRFSEMLALFRQAGFAIEVKQVLRWDSLPTPRNRLHQDFRSLPDEDLLVYGFDAVLRPS